MRPALLRGHTKPITVVKFNFDGDLLFTGSGEKVVNLWYANSGERIGSFEPKAAVRTLDVTNNSDILIVGTNVGTLEFFKIDGGQLLGHYSLDARFKTIQLSYGDKKLLTLVEWYHKDKSGVTELFIFDVEKLLKDLLENKTPQELKLEPERTITIKNVKDKYCQVNWGLLNKTIYAAREDGHFEIFDLEGNIIKSARIHDDRLHSFSVAKEHTFIVTCSKEGAKIIDPESLKILKTFKTEVPMNAGCISPLTFDPKYPKYHAIIAGGVAAIDAAMSKGGGFEVRLLNLVNEEEIGRISGHFGPVNALAFYPDGRGFVSGGEEGIIRLFRFNEKYFKEFE